MAFAAGQDELGFILQPDAVRFGLVQFDRIQILERAVKKTYSRPRRPGHKDQTAALLLDQALEQFRVVVGQFVLPMPTSPRNTTS